MSPPSKSRIRAQQDRHSSSELLEIYGSLLTPKQYAMTSGYCMEGKSFSQIAREQGVSRQAVHEAVRGVQRLLRYYEEKLKLKELPRNDGLPRAAAVPAGGGDSTASVAQAIDRLGALRAKVGRKGSTATPEWIVQEIDNTIGILEGKAPKAAPKAAPAKAAAKKPAAKVSRK